MTSLTPYPVDTHPAIGRAIIARPGVVLVKLSTKKRTQAPGVTIARVRAAELLATDTAHLSASIVAQAQDSSWMLWEVRTTFREIHEHSASVADLPSIIAADPGKWYLNGSIDRFSGSPSWGYVEAVTPDDSAPGALTLTLTDPMGVATLSPDRPTAAGSVPNTVTISSSYGVGETCALCGAVVAIPAAVIS